MLSEKPDDIRGIFTQLCADIHKDVDPEQRGGTTALISYFDLNTHRFINGNLGDSEAKIYRKERGKVYSIPTSCVRNWCSKKDIKRMEDILNPQLFKIWNQIENAKFRRFPHLSGVNVSRSIGDKQLKMDGKSPLCQKPKVTECQLRPGDLVIHGCDGLWDFIDEQKFINDIINPFWGDPDIVDAIVDYALRVRKSQDNITVISTWVSEDSTPPELPSTQPLSKEEEETEVDEPS